MAQANSSRRSSAAALDEQFLLIPDPRHPLAPKASDIKASGLKDLK